MSWMSYTALPERVEREIASGERFDFGGGFDDAQVIAEPLDDRAADEDGAFEGVGDF